MTTISLTLPNIVWAIVLGVPLGAIVLGGLALIISFDVAEWRSGERRPWKFTSVRMFGLAALAQVIIQPVIWVLAR